MNTAAVLILTLGVAAADFEYFADYGSEDDISAYSQTVWGKGDRAFLAVDDGNLRKTAAADGEVVRTLPLGTEVTIVEAPGEPVKIGLRVDRWYAIEATVDGETARGFLFGSSLTPFRFEGDFDDDGETEIAAIAMSGWFAPRVRVLEPGIDKKKKHAAVLNVPEDLRGRKLSARFVPRKGRKPPVFVLSHCNGDLCTHSFVRYHGKKKRKQKVGRLKIDYNFEGAPGEDRKVQWLSRRYGRKFCSGKCGKTTKFETERSEHRLTSFELESEARGPDTDVPCVPVGRARSGKYSGRRVVSCVVTYPGKQSPDVHNPVRYIERAAKDWVELSSSHPHEGFARDFESRLKKRGYRVRADPSVVLHGMAQTKELFSDARGAVVFDHHANKDFDPKGLKIAFAHDAVGRVYYETAPTKPSFAGALFVPQPEGSYRVYRYTPKVSKIRWLGGRKGSSASKYTTERRECGVTKVSSDIIDPGSFKPKDLEVIGVTKRGVPLYGTVKLDHPIATEVYELAKKLEKKVANKEKFFASVPMFLRRDSFGRLVRFTRTDLMPPDMCEPVVYFYPDRPRRVRMEIDDRIHVYRAEPRPDLPHTWFVDAVPGQRNVVWWEGVWRHFEPPRRGFSVAREDTRSFLRTTLAKLGLSDLEANDFIATWAPRLEESPYNTIYFYDRKTVDELVPMTLSPEPDVLLRVMMDFRPTEGPETIEPPVLPTPSKRDGFTVVEWGGVDRARSNVVARGD